MDLIINMMLLHFLFYGSCIYSGVYADFECAHTPLSVNELVTGVPLDREHTIRKRSTSQNLRIHAHYDSSFNQQTNAAQLKTEIVDVAIEYWQNALKIQTASSTIHLFKKCSTNQVTYNQENGQFVHYCMDGCAASTVCGPVTVPADHLGACREVQNNNLVITGSPGAGISNADYILYISSSMTARCSSSSSVLGYASHCQLEGVLDRPIAGFINFCPGRLSLATGYKDQSLFTAKHEILHALGFSIGMFAFYRNATGAPLTPRSPTTGMPNLGVVNGSYYDWSDVTFRQFNVTWGSKVGSVTRTLWMCVLPSVLNEARAHFNCSSLSGLPMEDQGGAGVSLTHWEKRILENDLMTPTYTQENRISRMTLALMEDTGWYIADYTKAIPLKWGKNLGCSFVEKSCYDYMADRRSSGLSIDPFCEKIHDSNSRFNITCTVEGASYGYCNLIRHQNPLADIYQYFTSLNGIPTGDNVALWGGSTSYADYCPFVQSFLWKNSDGDTSRTTQCNDANNQPQAQNNYLMEYYGSDAVCANQEGSWASHMCGGLYDLNVYGAGCYKFRCTSSQGLILEVNSRSYPCPRSGFVQNVTDVTRYHLNRGFLICPTCQSVCPSDSCPASPSISNPAPNSRTLTEPCSASSNNGHLLLLLLPLLLDISWRYFFY